ncbi:MAG: type II toxin-antitoxin system HicB family antitoxin [Phycisphaerae bacterium]|nr:type II toxin-antitoxin system HicB family antitoxin [Phycisphaerae bacterium]
MASQYQIILDPEDGCWYGRGLELPNVFGQGRTEHQCVISTREALTVAVATMLEAGQTPPAPAKQGARTMQVNIRLTPEEKVLLEASAKSKGFRGISDLMRAAALSS